MAPTDLGQAVVMSNAMTIAEREAFLADLHVGVLAVTHADTPLATPIWYVYEPGGDIWFLTSPDSIKGRALRASGRFSLCAQTEAPPYRYVTVEGSVRSIESAPHDAMLHMARRYLGEEGGTAYAAASSGDSSLFRLKAERWYTVDYGKRPG